ncbi:MAG: hypothetical protein LBL05_09605 [Synergistaceae bacterium]|jgi:hypothetical protein|nr:hypothetical protein [Synergistaceae bacterium]
MLKRAVFTALAALALTTAFAPNAEAAFGTDVVGAAAVTSFGEILGALPSPSANETEHTWVIAAPDGQASFSWRSAEEGERPFDVYISFDAAPFVNAGLDADKLPAAMKPKLPEGQLVVGGKLSNGMKYAGDVTPLSSFEQIALLDRDAVGFHAPLGHYGVTVADGFVFEFAEDMSKNDKDIVFVLDPKVFIDAGAIPEKVEGWTFGKVPLEDEWGRPFEAEKFLKPFDLE